MRSQFLVGALVSGSLLVAPGCGPICACEPAKSAAIIFGTVTDSAGAALGNALVTAKSAVGTGCPASYAEGSASTGSAGHYRLLAFDYVASDSVCVLVRVRRAGSTELLTLTPIPVRLSLRFDAPFDSVRVDGRVPAVP